MKIFLRTAAILALLCVLPYSALAAKGTLTWVDNSTTEDGFIVERKDAGGSYAELARLIANATTYVDTTLTPSQSVCYRVKAYNTGGVSGPSNEACGIAPPTAPNDPTNLNVTIVP